METRPVVRVVEKRKGEPLRAPPKVQRYRAGRIPDYAKGEDSSGDSDDASLEPSPNVDCCDPSESDASAPGDSPTFAQGSVDLNAILESIHAHDRMPDSSSAESEDDSTSDPDIPKEVVDQPTNNDLLVKPCAQPIKKRLRLKPRQP